MNEVLAVLAVLGAAMALVTRFLPLVRWLSNSSLRLAKARREDYAFTSQIRKDLQDPEACELERMQAYAALLKDSSADPLGVPVIMNIREPTAMNSYRAAGDRLKFCESEQWFVFRGYRANTRKRKAMEALLALAYFGTYGLAFVPLLRLSGNYSISVEIFVSAVLWCIGFLLISMVMLLSWRMLSQTEAFLKRMEPFRPLPAVGHGQREAANEASADDSALVV